MGMKTKAMELGSLPVLAPNFSSARGIAISSSFIAAIPSGEPYILDAQQRSPNYFPTVLEILWEIRPDLRYMKEALNFMEVEHHLSTAPLTDHKVNRLIAYLKNINLKAKDTVIFDLTCNFAPGPHMNTKDKRPQISGRANVKVTVTVFQVGVYR